MTSSFKPLKATYPKMHILISYYRKPNPNSTANPTYIVSNLYILTLDELQFAFFLVFRNQSLQPSELTEISQHSNRKKNAEKFEIS